MNRDERENYGQNEPYSQDRFQADDKSAPLDNSVTNDENQDLNKQLSYERDELENEDDLDNDLNNDFDRNSGRDEDRESNDTSDSYFQKNSDNALDLDEDLKNG